MKIAITSVGSSLNDKVDANVEECKYLIIIDPVTYEYESIPIPDSKKSVNNGIRLAQLLARKKAFILLTGFCYTDIMQDFIQNGIYVITGFKGSVIFALQQYKTWVLSIPKHPA